VVFHESELQWIGNLQFSNPPIPGAASALRALESGGIAVKIVTGDHPGLAARLCSAVGWDPGRVVVGDEVDGLDPAALAALASSTRVFARMSPMQKSRVITALRGHGSVVGFLGDGANDAPAMHASDVGICAAHASDVARQSAGIILLRRELGIFPDAVREGRRCHVRIRNYLLMSLSYNFENIHGMVLAVGWLPHLPMAPVQLLLNNFLYDVAQVGIPTDRVGTGRVRKPVRWESARMRTTMIRAGLLSALFDLMVFLALYRLYWNDIRRFQTGWFMESLLTQILVVFVVRTVGIGGAGWPGIGLAGTAGVSLAGAVLLTEWGWSYAWGLRPLDMSGWWVVLGATIAYLASTYALRTVLFPMDAD